MSVRAYATYAKKREAQAQRATAAQRAGQDAKQQEMQRAQVKRTQQQQRRPIAVKLESKRSHIRKPASRE